jgi:hypothetical protein
MSYRRRISVTVGMTFWLLACFAHQAPMACEPKRVLLLYHSFATNLVHAKAIRAELDRQMANSLEIYDAPLLPGSDESVAERYADYVQTRFRDQKLALVITIGADATDLFRRYRNQIFPSAALLALLEKRRIPGYNFATNEGAVGSSTDFNAIMENMLQVLPDIQCGGRHRQFFCRKILAGTDEHCVQTIRRPCIFCVVQRFIA